MTASADKTLKTWDVESGKLLETWTIGKTVNDMQVGLVWTKNGLPISLSLNGTLNFIDGKK